MTFEEIKELTGLGFTPDQIVALSAGKSQPAADVEDADKSQPADPEPAEEQDPAEEPTEPKPENPELSALKDQITQTQKQLTNLVRQMQQNNLRTASVNILPEDDLEKRTDAAMAELIRPTFKKEGENK